MKLTLDTKLGDGAFGDVWLATDDLDREVAVKIIHPSACGVSDAIAHAKALARAAHPNVVAVFAIEKVIDPDSSKKVDAVVMERLSGKTLGELLLKLRLDVARFQLIQEVRT